LLGWGGIYTRTADVGADLVGKIEAGNLGGKGMTTHASAVVADTVGDPFKDTAGHSLNILIKLIWIVALVFAPLFVMYALA